MSITLYKRNAIGSFCAGIVAFCIFGWLFFGQASFYLNSMPLSGRVIGVSYEMVPRGRGSAMAYVPIVELDEFGQGMRIKVDTSDDSPVYSIGSLMGLRCTRESTPLCRENKFASLWAASVVAFFITLAFLCLGLIFTWKSSRKDFTEPTIFNVIT